MIPKTNTPLHLCLLKYPLATSAYTERGTNPVTRFIRKLEITFYCYTISVHTALKGPPPVHRGSSDQMCYWGWLQAAWHPECKNLKLHITTNMTDDKKEYVVSTFIVWHSGGTYEDLNTVSLLVVMLARLFCERLDPLLATSPAQLASRDKPV